MCPLRERSAGLPGLEDCWVACRDYIANRRFLPQTSAALFGFCRAGMGKNAN
jgi:hypothetical protein